MAAKRPSFQWYSADWLKDPGVRSVSLAARGLWIEMLCLMDQSPRRGHLTLSDKPLSAEVLARMTGTSTEEVSRLLQELSTAGVYSSTESGIHYSRRMVRDEANRSAAVANGKLGAAVRYGKNSSIPPPMPPPIGGNEVEEEVESEDSKTLTLPQRVDAIYQLYPRKVGKPRALAAIAKALTKVSFDKLKSLVCAYAEARIGEDSQFTPHPATWFNEERFNDDPATWKRSGTGPAQIGNSSGAGSARIDPTVIHAAPGKYKNFIPKARPAPGGQAGNDVGPGGPVAPKPVE